MKWLSLRAVDADLTRADAQLEAVLERHRSFISEIVSRLAPQHLGVQRSEIEQETIVRLWRSLRNERKIRDFPSYIYRVAATAALDAIREVKKRQENPFVAKEMDQLTENPSLPGSRAISPEDEVGRRQLLRRIQTVLDDLPSNRRRAVKLHLQGFTSEEIAEVCGWSEPKARNLTYRGLDELRRGIHEAGIEHDAV